MPTRVIDWRYIPMADGWEDTEPDVTLWLDVVKVDRAWRGTGQYIVPGGANGQDRRYAKVGEWFAKVSYSNMLVISLEDERHILFTDGRHRFSWLRDHGAQAIQFQVSPTEARQLGDLLGTALVETVVKTRD
jgi:hypothetical protein